MISGESTEQPLVSLIIRTRNEERWITSCLRAVFQQTYKNIEVVIVDNGSADSTLKRVQAFPVTLVNIDEFIPGKAINDGIRASTGDIIVCLSGHCVPVNSVWLENLVRDLSDSTVAGVYGRQEPLAYSSDLDKRDLITVFGFDKKIQMKDSFFHNANSAFTRHTWEAYPFDEEVTNIEDRVWGQKVIAAGMKIIYEPEASVYHWHGIHHDLNPERARKIVRILESLEGMLPRNDLRGSEETKIFAVIPVRGESKLVNGRPLLEYTMRVMRQSRLISHVFVATDNVQTAELAKNLGALVPFIRPPELSEDYISVADILQYTLHQIESEYGTPDLVALFEETYPFRPIDLPDKMIGHIMAEGHDTVLAARHEKRGMFLETDKQLKILAEGFMPSNIKQSKAMIGLMGLACITRPVMIRSGDLLGDKIALFEVEDPLAAITVRNPAEAQIAERLLDSSSDEQLENLTSKVSSP